MADVAHRTPIQPRALKTRAALVIAASGEFSARGYALTTAKSIAGRAKVGTGTFYHYFPDKDAVLRELTGERVRHLLRETAPLAEAPSPALPIADLAADARRRLQRLVELYIDYHRHERGLHAVISERRLCDPELDTIMCASEREAVQRIEGTLRQWAYEGDTETAALMMFSLIEGAVHGHVLGQPMVSDVRFRDGLVTALLRLGMPRALFATEFVSRALGASEPVPARTDTTT